MDIGMYSCRFVVDFAEDADGLWYSVDGGEFRGPFVESIEREQDLASAITRARREAEELGGFLRRTSYGGWIVTVPDGVAIEGGEALPARRAA